MTYQTDNIAIAAALKVHGFRLDKIEITDRRGVFHFEQEGAQEAALQVQYGTRLVDAIQFHQELRRLSGLARTMSNRE